ncbi:hypothetical protein, partial [Fangia hongkongensis]|uniref:hypothetical protein n=2 Tax=Fangia hongkongensis TaxID=270495 RepID=UPI0019053F92
AKFTFNIMNTSSKPIYIEKPSFDDAKADTGGSFPMEVPAGSNTSITVEVTASDGGFGEGHVNINIDSDSQSKVSQLYADYMADQWNSGDASCAINGTKDKAYTVSKISKGAHHITCQFSDV